ncbi:hypothetical protein F4821DRAFT_212863 [Hypoxylon rubiginosum]|uniref:Uncharacterized protein n=1 Tax=Hypoxylon rubiginosum TaxID=110542 RepID=A0ACC0DF80_9PEZI|nr:hypothetical protein F4821DRAFT_212863 [Hypoxylon rubiginosum]
MSNQRPPTDLIIMETNHIDSLLARYLHLLNHYTSVREQLSGLQTAMYQDIARANFSAERGMRFGQDYYDERMQASRRVEIIVDNEMGIPGFEIISAEDDRVSEPETRTTGDENTPSVDQAEENSEDASAKKQQQKQKKQQQTDPLRWFGLLTPPPLRQAQAQSISAVEQIIPDLVTVSAYMASVELEIRRARKRRAKWEAAAAKKKDEDEKHELEQEQEQEQEREIGTGTEIAA